MIHVDRKPTDLGESGWSAILSARAARPVLAQDIDCDYLVVGATFPPRVHVISHNQTVDYSQMMRRIESAFASRGEPTTAP